MHETLEKLKKYIDCDWYIKNNISIKKYYKTNKRAYRWFHSKDGFMHMSISFDNKVDKNGTYYQPCEVIKYIKDDTKKIMELGCGQGANLYYLGSKYPNISFTGIDLNPNIDKKLENVELIKGDYHNLDMIRDNSCDIVYAFETLCYSTNKDKIFNEVYRILKKDGVFIIFDGYAKKKRDILNSSEEEIMTLVEKGMALDCFEYFDNIKSYAKNYKEVLVKDLSVNVLPNMKRFKRIVTKGMSMGFIFKIMCKILPKAFVGNAISGYLMSETIENNLFCYMEHIYMK